MRTCSETGWKILIGALLGGLVTASGIVGASAQGSPVTNEIRIVELEGEVEVSPAGATTWVLTQTNQLLHPRDRARTGPNSRFTLRWSDQSVVRFGASTELEILPPRWPGEDCGLHLVRGILSFLHRDEPGRIRVITRGAVAGVEGTEFAVAVAAAGGAERTTLSVIDGRVRFENEFAALLVTNGQQAVAAPGQAPVRTAGFIANNVLQWCFYYPAVLDPAELEFTPETQAALAESLAAYRLGDLPAALAKYPAARAPESDAVRVYHAALLLSVGEVENAEAELASVTATNGTSRPERVAVALRQVIGAVKRQPAPPLFDPQLATECLALSYYEQSQALPGFSLAAALRLAEKAAALSPEFGYAWERVAELEFGFGRTQRAMDALDRSLALAPRNAQALALKGYLLAAQNRPRAAIEWFNRALAVDAALANAWLGRGLCRIRGGDEAGGREDLLVAVALEPQRAELRSYLGKTWAETGDFSRADRELQLARDLDPGDPTAWLYSALIHQENNQINPAIRDLERSVELNDNRSVYRSRLLLDEDRAVRTANLAAMYRDAGMSEVAVREAIRSVNYDYGNYSAHLFLANSYHELSDPNLINLRYETPAENEYLLADLLAPVSAGVIAPVISQHEYSRLFDRDPRFGVVSDTEYLSRGAWTESGAQYGRWGNFAYAVEAFYRSDPGQRVNDDVEQRQITTALKLQLTPQDTVDFRIWQYQADAGDLAQYYDPAQANPAFRVSESQDPIVSLGFHHEWSPGVHTLFLAGRLGDRLSLTNPTGPTLVANRPDIDPVTMPGVTELTAVHGITMANDFIGKLDVYSAELQQIWQVPDHNTIVGTRFQDGRLHTQSVQNSPSADGEVFDPTTNAAQQDFNSQLRRFSVYAYHQWQVADPLQLIGGVAYDRLTYPRNFRYPPISAAEDTADQVSPKLGAIWTPARRTTVRAGYARSLTGASLEQSFQLEPSQVAGFIQSYRSLIPESVAGPNSAARNDVYGISLEQKLESGTYLGVAGDLLKSSVDRTVGAFDVFPDEFDWAIPSGLRENLDFEERALTATANQLLGRFWSCGATYRFSQAQLKDNFVDVPDGLFFNNFAPRQRSKSTLHQLVLSAVVNHPNGLFARQEALWYAQDNEHFVGNGPDDDFTRADFWQFNTYIGYRFPRRRAEIMVGLLNLTDQDYKLNPLNVYNELPRRRTLAVRLQLNF